jgi:hypothetical protein
MDTIRSGDSELVAAKNSSWIHPGYYGRLESRLKKGDEIVVRRTEALAIDVKPAK